MWNSKLKQRLTLVDIPAEASVFPLLSSKVRNRWSCRTPEVGVWSSLQSLVDWKSARTDIDEGKRGKLSSLGENLYLGCTFEISSPMTLVDGTMGDVSRPTGANNM